LTALPTGSIFNVTREGLAPEYLMELDVPAVAEAPVGLISEDAPSIVDHAVDFSKPRQRLQAVGARICRSSARRSREWVPD